MIYEGARVLLSFQVLKFFRFFKRSIFKKLLPRTLEKVGVFNLKKTKYLKKSIFKVFLIFLNLLMKTCKNEGSVKRWSATVAVKMLKQAIWITSFLQVKKQFFDCSLKYNLNFELFRALSKLLEELCCISYAINDFNFGNLSQSFVNEQKCWLF